MSDLLDVRPVLSLRNQSDGLDGHAITGSDWFEFLAAETSRTDGPHVILRQSRSVAPLSARCHVGFSEHAMRSAGCLPSLRYLISEIRRLVPEPQMPTSFIGNAFDLIDTGIVVSHAPRCIADMANEFISRRPSSGRQPPCDDMHPLGSPLPGRPIIRHTHYPVAKPVVAAGGQPTSIRLYNARPEQISGRCSSARVGDAGAARVRAETAFAFSEFERPRHERSAASLTDTGDGTLRGHRTHLRCQAPAVVAVRGHFAAQIISLPGGAA